MKNKKSTFTNIILLLSLSVLLTSCQTLKTAYMDKKVCPKCHKTTTLSYYEDEDHDFIPSFKDIKAKCPTCGKTYTVDEILQSQDNIHICSTCGVMVDECPVCNL